MEDFLEDITNGNVNATKVVLTSVVMALAIYQLGLISIGYQVVKVRFLQWGAATAAHRITGHVVVVVTAAVAIMCLSVYGLDEDGGTHAISGAALMATLAAKILTVRTAGSSARALPWLGGLIFVLFAVTWWTSAADYLGGGGDD